jgi:hypothetical protein
MKSGLVLIVVVCSALALAVWWWGAGGGPMRGPERAGAVAGDQDRAALPRGGAAIAATDPSRPPGVPGAATPVDGAAGPPAALASRQTSADLARAAPRATWPAARTPRDRGAPGDPSAEPAVSAELAFRALRYVGVDPEAERTWQRAIRDPDMPAGVRSDLIEDLNQEGYRDNGRPTAEDLPLILARLELIERLAPLESDPVNAAAFAEAYKDLLAMYVRLGGAPRGGR